MKQQGTGIEVVSFGGVTQPRYIRASEYDLLIGDDDCLADAWIDTLQEQRVFYVAVGVNPNQLAEESHEATKE